LERVIEERRRLREKAIKTAREFARCVSSKLGEVVVVVYGSYARGDFNEWSDIDVLVVAKSSLPVNPLKRLDLVAECLAETPGVECVLLTPLEFKILVRKRNPIALSALREGVLVTGDITSILNMG
jgi:predicted nucleotidyltransferase